MIIHMRDDRVVVYFGVTAPLHHAFAGMAELCTLRRQDESQLRILTLTSVCYCLPSVCPKQLCALAHLGCTREAGTS